MLRTSEKEKAKNPNSGRKNVIHQFPVRVVRQTISTTPKNLNFTVVERKSPWTDQKCQMTNAMRETALFRRGHISLILSYTFSSQPPGTESRYRGPEATMAKSTPSRLYQKGVITSYKRARKDLTPRQALVKIQGRLLFWEGSFMEMEFGMLGVRRGAGGSGNS